MTLKYIIEHGRKLDNCVYYIVTRNNNRYRYCYYYNTREVLYQNTLHISHEWFEKNAWHGRSFNGGYRIIKVPPALAMYFNLLLL